MPLSFLPKLSRRDLIVQGTKMSVASLALLTGLNTKILAEETSGISTQDIDVLNEILGTEHEGIAAYQICMNNNLLLKSTIKIALIFQDHHKTHRDILSDKITSLGGTPVVAKTNDEYTSDLNTVSLTNEKDALKMIVKLERGAANAYIGMLPSTNDHELVKVAGRIAADEVTHCTTLSALLHLPLPPHALSYGA